MKTLKIFSFVVLATVLASFTFSSNSVEVKKEEAAFAYFKLVNDTDENIRIHTGSGVVPLTKRGGSTSITCEKGRKIYTAPKGSKDKLIFEVTTDMCGKTIKLSKYL